ncbi:nucleotidyltransferase domain-containing protein [Methanosarcina sp. Z-7115]|uniref:Nucleotidyltransferase domain-containing protein n=1 Tax=Methanosarcina baikalica TaxID=3073890 RepID=A0ABU2D235_9EURY|nr:nucleotidyltransferase domain-containing protein [Methanosarcina sp. Z-7115]MDR7666043.1 nucleotidyltransferase domain-containing protein [Methanosarcina sp. Z-7115]
MSSFYSSIPLDDHKENILTWRTLSSTKSCSKKFFLEKEGATKIAIFGSYAKGKEKPESDIDILVEFSES